MSLHKQRECLSAVRLDAFCEGSSVVSIPSVFPSGKFVRFYSITTYLVLFVLNSLSLFFNLNLSPTPIDV